MTERSPRAALALVVGVTVVASIALSLVHVPSAVLFASLLGGMAHALSSPTPLELPPWSFRLAQGTIGVVIGALVSAPALERIGHSLLPIGLVMVVSAFSCTGLGLINAGLGLRIRENAVLSNIMFGLLLLFTGANVPLETLPGGMQAVSEVIPLTHGIEAARRLADGESLGDVAGLVAAEAAIGVVYIAAGYGLLRYMERQSRLRATLQIA